MQNIGPPPFSLLLSVCHCRMPIDALLLTTTNHHVCHDNNLYATAFGIKRVYFAAANKDYKLDCNEGDKPNCVQECSREFPSDPLAVKECTGAVERAYSV
jgi:hypothetical protein